MVIDKKIQELGLTDKEAKVYIALLEHGQATAQEIAARSGVNRATTYVMLDSLLKRGLVSTVEKDKRTLFLIEEPFSLLKGLEEEKDELESRIAKARKLIPELQLVYNLSRDRSKVRLLEGRESLRIIRKDIVRSKSKEVCMIVNAGHAMREGQEDEESFAADLERRGIRRRILEASSGSVTTPSGVAASKSIERITVSQDSLPITSEIILYNENKVVLMPYSGGFLAVVIENQDIYNTMKTLFEAAWNAHR